MAGLAVPPPESSEAPSIWRSYANVKDFDASVTKVNDQVGTICKNKVDLPMGSFAVVKDPDVAVFPFWKCNPQAY